MGLSDAEMQAALAAYLTTAAGAQGVEILSSKRLGGGAIQDNYALEAVFRGGARPGRNSLVLRADAPSGVTVSMSRAQEFAVLRAAWSAGVTVPEPLWACEDSTVLGRSFVIMQKVAGSSSPRALTRCGLTRDEREALVEQLGRELGRLHNAIRPPVESLSFLEIPSQPPALHRITLYRRYLDELSHPHPVLEYGLRWLELNAPQEHDLVLCHSDFRTGNYMVEGARMTAILDWEFASWSDPLEDLGWFCARCWRFGSWQRAAGGVGSRGAFYRGYEAQTGRAVPTRQVDYWEVMAAVRWGIIALQQAHRHVSGKQVSLELALTGRMVPEMEMEIVQKIEQIERQDRRRD